MDNKPKDTNKEEQSIKEFETILRRLRRECPWDKKQTWDSLRTQTIEEVYELAQAISDKSIDDVRKELGDVFLHVAFYSLIAEEQGLFDFADVVASLNRKLIYRHPHVYGEAKAKDTEEVSRLWEHVKLKEQDSTHSVLGGVPDALPALIKAYRIQGKVKNVGFDWEDSKGAWDKLREEMREFAVEAERGDRDRMESEMGDLLFSAVNLSRHYGINAENALERTNKKFIARFNHVEQRVKEQGKELKSVSLEEMDNYWEEAKKEKNEIYRKQYNQRRFH